MRAREIKAKLAEKNIRQIDLAKKWRLPTGTVAQLVNRKMKSARLDKRLARVLEVTVEELRGEQKGAA
jgi:transcriptional regulator with XRE-family HTH domain